MGQNHDTPSGHTQFIFEVGMSNVSQKEMDRPDTNYKKNFQ